MHTTSDWFWSWHCPDITRSNNWRTKVMFSALELCNLSWSAGVHPSTNYCMMRTNGTLGNGWVVFLYTTDVYAKTIRLNWDFLKILCRKVLITNHTCMGNSMRIFELKTWTRKKALCSLMVNQEAWCSNHVELVFSESEVLQYNEELYLKQFLQSF